MTSITSFNPSPIDISKLKKLDVDLAAYKISDEYAEKMKEFGMAEIALPGNVMPKDEVYAYVKKDGKVVATLYNSGAAETSNAGHAKIKGLPTMGEDESRTGPELAAARAREIADTLDGSVEKVSTALTQSQWQSTWAGNIAFMSAEAQAARDAGAKTNVNTQLIGQAGDEGGAVAEFLEFMSKTPEERWHEQWLRSKGITEEEFNAMSADEKQALIDEMTEELKQQALDKAKEAAA